MYKNTNMVLKGKNTPPLASYTNLVANGDFSDGTTGWAAGNATNAVSVGILSNTGDGSGASPYIDQIQTGKSINTNVYWVKAKARITNSDCTTLRIRTYATAAADTTQASPVINTWYEFSFLRSATGTGNFKMVIQHIYADAGTANGKVMEVDGTYGITLINLTALFGAGNEPTAAWCDTNLPFVVSSGEALRPLAKLVDRSRYFNNGVFTGTTWEQLASGLWAMNFETAANKVTVSAHKSINNMPQMTFSAWVYYTGAGGGGAGRIFSKGTKYLYIDSANNRLAFVQTFSGDDGTWNTPSSGLTTAGWYHVQLSYDRTLTTNDPVICINGVSKAITESVTPVGTADTDVASDLITGNSVAADRYLNGKIAMPKIWNVLRTGAQALKDYTATKFWFGL